MYKPTNLSLPSTRYSTPCVDVLYGKTITFPKHLDVWISRSLLFLRFIVLGAKSPRSHTLDIFGCPKLIFFHCVIHINSPSNTVFLCLFVASSVSSPTIASHHRIPPSHPSGPQWCRCSPLRKGIPLARWRLPSWRGNPRSYRTLEAMHIRSDATGMGENKNMMG